MAIIEGYNMPDELYYHPQHSWAKIEPDGTVRVGMNDFYQKQAGSTVYMDLPFEGDEVRQGEICGKIESRKWVGDLYAPVSGTVTTVNEALSRDSTLINKDPYGEGWLFLVKATNLETDLANLLHGPAVEGWLREEMKKAEAEKAKRK